MHKIISHLLVFSVLWLAAGCGAFTPTAQVVTQTTIPVISTATPVPATQGVPAATSTTLPASPAPSDTSVPPTQPPAATATSIPTANPTATQPPAATSVPTAVPTQSGTAASVTSLDVSAQKYIDNRSDPASLIASLFNAINRKEDLRAYSYWEASGSMQGTSYSAYQAGYAHTTSVQVVIGQVTGDAGAGNMYYSVPAGLTSLNDDGTTQRFAACYILHLANPGIQGTVPFQSLGIQNGEAQVVASGADLNSAVANACSNPPFNAGHALPPSPTFDPTDISSARYLDDRSDGLEVVRSYYNAINRSEYVRAYSYWEPTAASQQLPPLSQFINGYSNTQSVKLTTGTVVSNAGAGQLYYKVPVTLVATTKSSQTQTFVGCYTLHLGSPSAQGVPPFNPLGITSATLKQVDNSADTTALMNAACQ